MRGDRGDRGGQGGPPEEMRDHRMQMRGDRGNRGGQGGPPEEMREHRMQMRGDRGDRGGQGGPPEEMREHMNQMYGWQEENTHGEWRDDRPHRQHEGSEIIEFMHELELFSEVSSRLSDSKAVAMIGIHMIRDELDGELKMKAIDAIIKKSERGSPAHNAALIVAIQTMQEEGDDEAAADYMIELVISN